MKKEKIDKGGKRAESETIAGFHLLPRTAIVPDPKQPRKTFDDASLKELADSIADIGIVQNLMVRFEPQEFTLHEPDLVSPNQWTVLDRKGNLVCQDTEKECKQFIKENATDGDGLSPKYVLVAGERRLRAAALAKLDVVPCMVREGMEARDIVKAQFAENDGREALSPMDEAESFHDLVYVQKLFTADELAKELGKSRQLVFGRLKLAKLPKGIKEAVRAGALNAALAELVARVPGEKNQFKAMKEIQEGGELEYPGREEGDWDVKVQHPMSVRQATRYLREKYTLKLEEAVFDVEDQELLSGVGACKECPKRSGNCLTLFPELAKSPNVCTDPECYGKKKAAHIQRARDEAAAKGLTVLTDKQAKGFFQYGDFDPYHRKAIKSLNDEIPGDKKKRTFKEVLGDDAPALVAVISQGGKMHKFYQKELIEAALTQKGFKFEKSTRQESPEETARKEKVEAARTKLGGELIEKIIQFAGENGSDDKGTLALLRFIAGSLATQDWYAAKTISTKLGIRGMDDREKIQEAASKLKAPVLRQFIAASLVRDRATDYNGGWSGTFEAACDYAGIDLKKEEALVVKWAETDAAIDAKHDGKELPGAKFEKEIAVNKAKTGKQRVPDSARVKRGKKK